jgi:hypothetical protein
MTNREREYAALGIEYAEGIEEARVVVIPQTGREVRKVDDDTWEVQPYEDNYWLQFDNLLDAIRAGLPKTKE